METFKSNAIVKSYNTSHADLKAETSSDRRYTSNSNIRNILNFRLATGRKNKII